MDKLKPGDILIKKDYKEKPGGSVTGQMLMSKKTYGSPYSAHAALFFKYELSQSDGKLEGVIIHASPNYDCFKISYNRKINLTGTVVRNTVRAALRRNPH